MLKITINLFDFKSEQKQQFLESQVKHVCKFFKFTKKGATCKDCKKFYPNA